MSVNTRWSIFARTLEDILLKRQLSWQDLYEQVGIAETIVESLQASLQSPAFFPILTIEEMDDVIDIFTLNSYETVQLRAALIATSVERTLMECIESQAALLAAEQVFATTLAALVKQRDEKRGDTRFTSDEEPGKFFAQVKEYIFIGKEARQLSNGASTHVRARKLQEALFYFEQACNVLESKRRSLGSLKQWKQLYEQALQEIELTNRERQNL